MKTLLAVTALVSTVITTTPVFATDFSSAFVSEKITRHWELDSLEITQRIDVKKRREMEQKSATTAEKKLQAFEQALKKLMQPGGTTEVDEETITSMIGSFVQPGQDAEMIFMEATEGMMFPDQNELMLTDTSDYETSMMIEEAFTLKADGSVIYPGTVAAQGTEKNAEGIEEITDANAAAKWSFDAENQQLMLAEQREDLSTTVPYKLIELTDNRLVLEDRQPNGSIRMIFSSQ